MRSRSGECRYLSRKQRSAAGREVLQGRIERVNREVIEGWVWDPQASNEPIRLELLNGEERLNVVVANEDRPYLVQLGCGDGRHGFTLRLDEALPSDGRHALTLRCADTGAVMPGSPIIVGHERTATADRSVTINQPRRDLCGYIDEISKDGVIGWVMMPDRPMHRCIVALKENGRIIARATASQFRLDVLSADSAMDAMPFGCHCPLRCWMGSSTCSRLWRKKLELLSQTS